MKLYIRLEVPYEWVRVDSNKVDAFGEVTSLADYPISDEDEIVGIVHGESVTAHRVSLPAKSKRQFQTAVPYALEESVSEDVDDLHFVCPNWKSGSECTVYVIAKEKMREWQQLATQHKLAIDRLLPDYALLPFHDAADCSISLTTESAGESSLNQQQILTSLKHGGGACVDIDFLDAWLMDIPMTDTIAVNDQQLTEQLIAEHPSRDFRHWSFGGKLAHWLEHAPSQLYDLMTDEYRPSVSNSNWRAFFIPAGLLAFSIFLVFAFDTYRYFALHAEIKSLSETKQNLLMDTFSNIDGIEKIEATRQNFTQLQRRSDGTSFLPADNIQSMLADASAVLKAQEITLESIVFRESAMIITCQLSDFSQVDLLTTQLNARPRISASLQSSSSDDGKVVASYSIIAG